MSSVKTEGREVRLLRLNWNRLAMLTAFDCERSLSDSEKQEERFRCSCQNCYAGLFKGDICQDDEERNKLLNRIEKSFDKKTIAVVNRYVGKVHVFRQGGCKK